MIKNYLMKVYLENKFLTLVPNMEINKHIKYLQVLRINSCFHTKFKKLKYFSNTKVSDDELFKKSFAVNLLFVFIVSTVTYNRKEPLQEI